MLAISILICAAYGNTLHSSLQFDDHIYLSATPSTPPYDYPTVADFDQLIRSPHSLPPELAHHRYLKTRFVGYLTLWLDYRIHGLNTTGYHLVNICLHILNSCLLYTLLCITLRRLHPHSTTPWAALFTTLIFALHPMRPEGVTYIAQRFGLMASFFYLLSLTLYASREPDASNRRNTSLYATSIISAALAQLSKEMTITLPIVILLYDLVFLPNTGAARRFVRLLPFFALMAVIPSAYMLEHMKDSSFTRSLALSTRLDSTLPRLDYMLTQLRVMATYIRLHILPVGQNVDYAYTTSHSLFSAPVILSSLLHLALLSGAIVSLRSRTFRPAGFGILWFYIASSIESGFFPISEIIIEYRTYLPSVGLSFVAASIALWALGSIRSLWQKAALVTCFAALTVLLISATWHRNEVWHSRLSLWKDAVAKSPGKMRPHYNVSNAYIMAGKYEAAIPHLHKVIELNPGFAMGYNNLGATLMLMGRCEEAIPYLERAVKLQPNLESLHRNFDICTSKLNASTKR